MKRGSLIDSVKIEATKHKYQKGMRLELVEMGDIQAPPVGTQGTIDYVDDIGQIHMIWDNGSTLALIPEIDDFKIIKN